MLMENREGATDIVMKRIDRWLSLGKEEGYFFRDKKNIKLQDNSNISSNKEEIIREFPLGRLWFSPYNR